MSLAEDLAAWADARGVALEDVSEAVKAIRLAKPDVTDVDIMKLLNTISMHPKMDTVEGRDLAVKMAKAAKR